MLKPYGFSIIFRTDLKSNIAFRRHHLCCHEFLNYLQIFGGPLQCWRGETNSFRMRVGPARVAGVTF